MYRNKFHAVLTKNKTWYNHSIQLLMLLSYLPYFTEFVNMGHKKFLYFEYIGLVIKATKKLAPHPG